jgi:hypothetical protein
MWITCPKILDEFDELNQHSSDTECVLAQQHTLLWNEDTYLEISPGQKNKPLTMSMPKIYRFRAYTWGKAETFRIVWRRLCSRVLVVTVYVSPNVPRDNLKFLIFSNVAEYSPKLCNLFKFFGKEKL